MKDEILGGLRNALDRGESLEDAVKTLVSAGYNLAEVRESAESLSSSSISKMTSMQREDNLPKPSEKQIKNLAEDSIDNIPQNNDEKSPYDEMIEDKKKKSGLTIKMALIIMLVVLIVVIAVSALLIVFFPNLMPVFVKKLIS